MKLKEETLYRWLAQSTRKLVAWSAKRWVEWALLVAALVPFILISAFNHPTDDDFQGAVLARHLSLWQSIGFYYQSWTGRYTSSFLYGLVYEVSDLKQWLWALRLAPVLFVVALLVAGWFALGGLSEYLSNATKWKGAAYGLILYLYGIPLVASALYWFSGAAVYTAGIVLSLVLIGIAGRYTQSGSAAEQRTWGILGTGAAFLLVGTNELSMLAAVAGLTAWASRMPAAQRGWPVLILLVALAGGVLTMVAPGNMARAAVINHDEVPLMQHLLATGAKACYSASAHLVRWGSNGLLLMATALFTFTNWQLPFQAAFRRRWLLWAGVAGLLLAVASTVPTIWLTNDVPGRVWNAIYFVFLLSWFSVAFAIRARWSLPFAWTWRLDGAHGRSLRVAWLIVALLGQNTNGHQAYVDLFFKAPEYNKNQAQRYAQLQRAQQHGQHSVVVAPLFPNEYQYPATIFLHELELSSHDIANEGMAAYFGLNSISVNSLPQRTKRHFRD